MDIWITGLVMMGIGYWAAHIRLTRKRDAILFILSEARAILAKLESDRSKVVNGKDNKTDPSL